MKKYALLILILALLLSACSSATPTSTPEPTPVQTVDPTPEPTPEPVSVFADYQILFTKSVRNDSTGKWRVATTASSLVISDYAVDYYKEYFSSDDEIHFFVNLSLKTTTRITCSGSNLYVSVFEYVQGEEHDAKVLPGGAKLENYIVNIETGEKEAV